MTQEKRGRGRPRKTDQQKDVDRALRSIADTRGEQDPAMKLLSDDFFKKVPQYALRDRDKVNRLLRAKRLGLPDTKAAMLMGVGRLALWSWKKQAIDEIDRRESGAEPNTDLDYIIMWFAAYTEAQQSPVMEALKVIDEDVRDNRSVDTARWRVERLLSEDYSPTRRLEVTGKESTDLGNERILALPEQRLNMLASGADIIDGDFVLVERDNGITVEREGD